MIFNSVIFIFFFLPTVLLGSFVFRKNTNLKKSWIVLTGFLFYGWCNVRILIFLVLFGVVHYWFGKLLKCCRGQKEARAFILIPGIIFNLLCLYFAKYLNFSVDVVNRIFRTSIQPVPNIIVPLGMSFLCFSMISYLVDIYKEKSNGAENILDFFVYLTFFPKISQGPIASYCIMNDDIIHGGESLHIQNIADGARRFICGFGKKVLIADVLGASVDRIYLNLAAGITGATAWMGILCYTLQIYYDFSGYTDMAIGIAAMLGFHLPENFTAPYLSKSVSEFWRRWHITLGQWFKEYVYFPLGGSRRGMIRTVLNLSVVWMLTGLWHGASAHFVLWGVYFGVFVIIEKLISKQKWFEVIPGFCKWAITFFLVMMGWVIFRSSSISEMLLYFRTLLFGSNSVFGFSYFFDITVCISMSVGIILALPRPCFLKSMKKGAAFSYIYDIALVIVLISSIVFMMNSTYRSFIYFQF